MKRIVSLALTLSVLVAAGTAVNIAVTTGVEAGPITCGILCRIRPY